MRLYYSLLINFIQAYLKSLLFALIHTFFGTEEEKKKFESAEISIDLNRFVVNEVRIKIFSKGGVYISILVD